MSVERPLQISMAVLASLGTLLLGLGQQSVFLPCLAAVAAALSVVVTDSLKVFRLNQNIASAAAMIAVAYSVSRFLYWRDNEMQLLAIANLLVYLQIVLLFQRKQLRVYWSLSVLSLLQVVVASALNLNFSFGLLLAAYTFVGLTAMALLFIYREAGRFQARRDRADASAAAPGEPADSKPQPAAAPARRWPLAGQTSNVSGVGREDHGQVMLGRPLVRTVVSNGHGDPGRRDARVLRRPALSQAGVGGTGPHPRGDRLLQ